MLDSAAPDQIGRYRTTSLLGVGGFASVVRAHDERLDDDVAIKLLSAHFADDAEVNARFVREAQLLRRVDSPHVIAVHDIDTMPDGRPYMVMAYAGGGTVADRFEARLDPDDRSIVAVVDALGRGLAALHAAGVVHRDIKPENLLVSGAAPKGGDRSDRVGATQLGNAAIAIDERVMIGDLGLAKDQNATSLGPTILGGTPRYQSPEQRQLGAEITPATDTFAASAVLWFCLTGQDPPLPAALDVELPMIPEQWQGFFTRGLAVDPERRFDSAAAWHSAALKGMEAGGAGLRSGGGGALGSGASTEADSAGFHAATPGTTCPYKGLAAYQPEDAGLFFGRDERIQELLARLQQAATLVIGGPSGSGKSSLLRAGLIPRLRFGALPGSQSWKVALFSPGPDPLEELAYQLETLGGNDAVLTPERLRDAPHTVKRWIPDDRDVLLAIDQFEELFTQTTSEADQAAFLAVLDGLTAGSHARTRIVLSMRADFYDRAAHHPWLADRINANQVLVGPMRRAELREAIERPAESVGLRLEPGLADHILEDLGNEAGQLPLLGHAMVETWLRRRGNTLTLEGYRAAGGVAGAIANRAEETIGQLGQQQQSLARSILLQLTTPGDGAADTRRRVRLADLHQDSATDAIVSSLVEARLVTSDSETIEITHEALLTTWPRLRRWIDEARDDLRTRQRIAAAADEWERANRSPDLLYRGAVLETATSWMTSHPGELGAGGREFLADSVSVEDAERHATEEAEQRRQTYRRRATAALAALTVAALVATAGALVALRQSRANQQQAEVAFARALAAVSEASAADDPLLATGLALEAMRRSEPSTAESRAALVTARLAAVENERRLFPLASFQVPEADTIALSPDGQLVVVGDKTGTLTFHDVASRELVAQIPGHTGGVQEATFDNSGQWLATTGNDGALLLTDTTQLDAPDAGRSIVGNGSTIGWSVSFSPDGQQLAWATENRGIQVFDVATGERTDTGQMRGSVDYISVAHQGDKILAGRGDGMVDVFDVSPQHNLVMSYAAHDDGNDTWEIAPRGNLVLTVGSEGNANVWDVGTDRSLGSLVAADGISEPPGVAGIQLAPDRRLVVLGDRSGRVHLARLDIPVGASEDEEDNASSTFRVTESSGTAHALPVLDGALSADGTIYASLAEDQLVRLWRIDVSPPPPLEAVDPSLATDVLAANADGSLLIAGSIADGVGQLELISNGERAGSIVIDGEPTALAFNPENTEPATLFVGTTDGKLIELSVAPGSLTVENTIDTGQGFVTAVLAHPREPVLVVTGSGTDGVGRVRFWSTETLAMTAEAPNHPTEARQATVSADGEHVITAGGGEVRFARLDGSEHRAPVTFDDVVSVAASPDGEWLAIGDNAEIVHLVRPDNPGEAIHTLPGHDGSVRSIAFLPDGQSLAVLSGRRGVLLWDAASGVALGPAIAPAADDADQTANLLRAMAQAPDGRIWVAGPGVHRLTALDTDVGCAMSSDIFDELRINVFLGGSNPISCGS